MKTRKSEISQLKNLGPASEKWLNEAGIFTHNDLKKVGAVKAYHLVVDAGFRPTLNLLYALHGAIEDLHWTMITKVMKEKLKEELKNSYEKGQAE